MSYSVFMRFALICGLAAWSALAVAQQSTQPPAEPRRPITAGEAKERARNARNSAPKSSLPAPPANPHGARRQGPRIVPAQDLPPGEVEVRLSSPKFEGVEDREITLVISKQSIERGNVDTTQTVRTDARGVARFAGLSTESDHIYQVRVAVDAARYSTGQFQFKTQDAGLRIIMPIYKAQSSLDDLLLLTRTLVALVPQDDLFVVDVLFRVENYGEISWLPENVTFALPEGFKALTAREPEADAHFEPNGDEGVKLVGTLAPGQHDLMFRFHLPTNGEPNISFKFPTAINTAMVRVVLESSPTMQLAIPGFPEPDETRNKDGQRRLISGRDFLTEKTRAPEAVEVKISGIPTPAAGRSVAVGLAGVLAVAGLAQAFGRRRSSKALRPELSKEDRERASELLLEELISLEQAFQQGSIGRKTHEQAKRQLLEAFARLRADPEEAQPAEQAA